MSLLPGGSERELPNTPKVAANTNEDSSINVSPYYVAFFVLCMGLMLVLLYFFFDYLGRYCFDEEYYYAVFEKYFCSCVFKLLSYMFYLRSMSKNTSENI